jgi:SagB-type dehydrogenase family enzyme
LSVPTRNTGRPHYRRANSLVSYWLDDELVFHNYATGQKTAAAPIACEVLDFFDRWGTVESLAKHLNQFTPESLQAAVSQLVRKTFLERSGKSNGRTEKPLSGWKDWNPAAGFFHYSTRDTSYDSDLEKIDRSIRRLVRRERIPLLAKRYPRAPKTALPKAEMRGEFSNAIFERRTWRQFSPDPISLADLSALLGLTFSVRGWIPIPGIGKFPLTTSPSAGAMHSIEAYVLAQRVEGLAPGIYHYDSARHELALLRRGTSAQETSRFLAGQSWFAGAAAVAFLTAVFPRAQWKYRFPRAYRTVLIEAGHFAQTFCLAATAMGLAPFSTMALGVIYAAGVGERPAGMDWETGSVPEAWLNRRKRR